MSFLLEALREYPVRHFAPGDIVIAQGTSTGLLFVLQSGSVAVLKDEVSVATEGQPGAIFGDLSALLDEPHTATVRAETPCVFHVVSQPRAFLERTPKAALVLCELLARRLDAVNKYLVNVKQQFAGDEHLGMVDDVLDTLMNRQPRKRVRPRPSTLAEN